MFSGTYNAIAGKVKKGHNEIGEVTGTWNQSMSYKSKVNPRGIDIARTIVLSSAAP